MKQLDKKRLKKEGQEMSVIHERNVLAEVSQGISLSVDGIQRPRFKSCSCAILCAFSPTVDQMTSKFVTNLK